MSPIISDHSTSFTKLPIPPIESLFYRLAVFLSGIRLPNTKYLILIENTSNKSQRRILNKRIEWATRYCNTKGCNCNKNAESLHKQFLDVLLRYTSESVSLIPVIKEQMLAIYYKFNGENASEKTILENRLHGIAKNIEKQKKQKTRLKNEEIPYDSYLEFLADPEKEKKEITDQLAKCSKGVSNPEKCVEFAINYSMKLPSVWSSASYSDKRRLQFLIFPEGLFYNRQEDKCRNR